MLVEITIKIPSDDLATLQEIHKRRLLNPSTVIAAAIHGTCEYYISHGTLTFLTSDTKECHGCRFLPGAEPTSPEDPTPPNIIPGRFNAA